jgi:hypothetical protein
MSWRVRGQSFTVNVVGKSHCDLLSWAKVIGSETSFVRNAATSGPVIMRDQEV